MKPVQTLLLLLSVSLLGGCVTTQGGDKRECRFIERDLTQPWATRSYWCAPGQTSFSTAGQSHSGQRR